MPVFDNSFTTSFTELVKWRRDVRRFRPEPIPESLLAVLLNIASLSPSVGYSQPWRFVRIQEPKRRSLIRENFVVCNKQALDCYEGERARLYASLKLSGLDTAPEHIAVFCDMETTRGHGLGQKSMPEMREYSVVIACHTLWLASRAHGVGVGWVSIFNPEEISKIVAVPDSWKLIAYLCLGFPEEQHIDPELERHGWEQYRQPEVLLR